MLGVKSSAKGFGWAGDSLLYFVKIATNYQTKQTMDIQNGWEVVKFGHLVCEGTKFSST